MSSKCTEYTVDIPKESPVYKLRAILNQEYGVTDADYDSHGYHTVNYEKPGEEPVHRGADDCTVRSEEVMEFALDDWRKYRKQIETVLGHRLLWSIDDKGSAFPYDTAEKKKKSKIFLKELEDLIRLADLKLVKNGFSKGDDDYRLGMGTVLYWFDIVPPKEYLDMWPAGQREKWKGEIENSLRPYGLENIANHLLTRGGNGRFYVESPDYKPAGFNIFAPSVGINAGLYGIFEYAGLSPRFVEIFGLLDDTVYRCGTPIFRNYVVGLKVGDGYRLFDTYSADPDVKRKFHYPVAGRNMVEASEFWRKFWVETIGRRENDGKLGNMPEQGNTAFERVWSKLLLLANVAGEGNIPEADAKILCNLSEEGDYLPPYLMLAAGTICAELGGGTGQLEGLFQHPLPSIKGGAHYLAAYNRISNMAYSEAVPHANAVLEVDNRCAFGYEVLAISYYNMGVFDKAEQYFNMAEDLAVDEADHISSFYRYWGMLQLDTDRPNDAAASFDKFLEREKALEDTVVYANFLKGVAFERLGRKEEADAAFEEAFRTARDYLSGGRLKDVRYLFKWLSENVDKYKPKAAFLSRLFTLLGQMSLYRGDMNTAKKAFNTAAAFDISYLPLMILQTGLERLW